MKALILRGLPASGKTKLALSLIKKKEYDVIVCRDDIRMMIYRTKNPRFCDEELVTNLHRAMLVEAMMHKKSIVIPDTNLNNRWLKLIVNNIIDHGYECEIHDLEVPIDELVEHDKNRTYSVGEDVIRNMAKRYKVEDNGRLKPAPEFLNKSSFRPYVMPENGFGAVVFDIDGTLAIKSDRSPYDYSRVMEDTINDHIRDCVNFEKQEHKIVFLSGRDEECRPETIKWLSFHLDMAPEEIILHMRKHKDNRADYIVKSEIFDEHLSDHRVYRIYDDRNSVVSMWRNKGLTCLQVAPGNF